MKPHKRTDGREWHWVTEVPDEIQGERRELLRMAFSHTTRKGASWAGPSPRTWKFVFPDSGGYSTVSEIRQDQISPMKIAGILSGEAFSSHQLEAEVLGVLRRLVKQD